MLDYTPMHLAMRARARTLVVATTGTMVLSATATGFSRADGSFVDDGFWTGMEVTPVGFADNSPAMITAVEPMTLTTRGARAVEAAAPDRALTVGLPSSHAWENRGFKPVDGVAYVEEQFLNGPARQVSIGPGGTLEGDPMYVLHIHVPTGPLGSGFGPSVYADALIRHFAPRTALPLANGDVLRVRTDVGPFVGQLQQGAPGFAVKPVTIPFRIRSANLI